MKKCILWIVFCHAMLFGANGFEQELEDFSAMLSIRSLQNGITLGAKRQNTMQQNWFLQEIILSEELQKRDTIGQKLPFGWVQFVQAGEPNNCLAIDESGFFTIKSCSQDLKDGKLETVFSIMPTNTTAVQIRSLVEKGDECISTFENPNVPIERRFGLQPCILESPLFIDLKNLFVLTPPLITASPVN